MTGVFSALAAGGGVLSLAGAFQGASQTEALGDLQAGLLRRNARAALDRGREAESQYRLQVSQLIGSQRVGYATQGVVLDDGSASDVQASTAFVGELDAQQIRANAALEAWGYRAQAAVADFQSEQQAEAQRIGGVGQALGTAGILGFGG